MSPDRSPTTRFRPWLLDAVIAAILALVILGPTLVRRGYTLRGDMVFVPHQPWKGAWLGLDGSVPRSVPMDAVVWAFDRVLPGDLVQKLFLVAILVALALGVARLLADVGPLGRAAGMVLACWNPYVDERLGIGQWAIVGGYAVLPWLLPAVRRLREGAPGGAARTFVLLTLAGICAPSFGLVTTVVALAITLTGPGPRARLRLAGAILCMAVTANLPWILPSVLGASIRPPKGQFTGFAAAAESSAGALASTLSLGGIWKTSVVPTERTYAAVVLLAVVVSVSALVILLRRRRDDPAVAGLAWSALLALLFAWLTAWGPVASAVGAVTDQVPAVGILRDSTRYLAPLALAVALGFGVLVDAAVRWVRAHAGAGAPVGVTLALVPVALLPSMAWGLHGFLEPTEYPASWHAAARALDVARSDGNGPGATVVLPWRGSYRGFSWTGGHAVLDPAQRFFAGEVLTDDRLFLGDRALSGEDPYLAGIGSGLDHMDVSTDLRKRGIRFVLIERGPGLERAKSPGGKTILDTGDLQLIDLGRTLGPGRQGPPDTPVALLDALVAALFFVSSCRIVRTST